MASTAATVNGSSKSSPQTKPEAEAAADDSSTIAQDVEQTVDDGEPEDASEDPAEGEDNANVSADVSEKPAAGTPSEKPRWPGWPGDCVFRLVVPVLKVGSIIGRKGELIKKMCEETRARIRVLDGPVSSPDRIVLISGKEEPEASLSPAMDATIRVFKRVSGLPENEGDVKASGAAGLAFCSIRLLVASTQAINLIGKQGSLIKSIQEGTGASVRVLSNDDMPVYASSDERIVELTGEALKVLKGLEAVISHLRKFLVDHSVLPLFEKNYNVPATQERQVEPWSESTLMHTSQPGRSSDYSRPLPAKREPLLFEQESPLGSSLPSRLSIYGQEPGLSGIRASGLGHTSGPIVTQVSQTMQIPLTYAEDIIGVAGSNIGYIRRTSGAILTVQESRGLPDEITVEIKGTSSQVQTAQQLIQESISGRKEPHPSSYNKLDSGLRSSYSQLGSSSYSSSSYAGQSYGTYGSSGVGSYSSFRL